MTPSPEPLDMAICMAIGCTPFWLGSLTCVVLNRLQSPPRPGALSRETTRYALRSQVVHRSFEAVARRTGYPVPQALRDFYAKPGFLHMDRFEAPGLPIGRRATPQLIVISEFLPLIPLMVDNLRLPDTTWLPFARGRDGTIYFLPLEEYRDGDGPVYRFDPEMAWWERERGNDIRRVSDSLRGFLRQGARVTIPERGRFYQ